MRGGVPDGTPAVSLVDGYNLPMSIIPAATNCSVASCPVDLVPGCPTPLVGPLDPTGSPVGCKSACEAGIGDTPCACATLSSLVPPPDANFLIALSELVQLLHWEFQHRGDVSVLGRGVLLLLQFAFSAPGSQMP